VIGWSPFLASQRSRTVAYFLAGSKPRSFPTTPVVLADYWESTIPALGFLSLPSRDPNRSRSSAFRRFHVPWMRHFLNQS
jgi:hypothetical protein